MRSTFERAKEFSHQAADIRLAAEEAVKAAQEATTPDPHAVNVRELASHEQSALLRLGPKRNRWRDLQEYDERIVEIEQRRTRLLEELVQLKHELAVEPQRHSTAVADWIVAGQQGQQPTLRTRQLEEQIAERNGEYEALGILHGRLLQERVEHVARNRKKMAADIDKWIRETAEDYRRAIDTAEGKRRELIDLRQS